MENTESAEISPINMIIETHIFTTMRYKNQADNGFSGNMALLVEAVQHSDKVLDNDIKLLAKGIFESVLKHKIIKHTDEDIRKALQEKEDKEKLTKEKNIEN